MTAEGLDPSVVRDLIERHGSIWKAGVWAIRESRYADEFKLIGAFVIEADDGELYPHVPQGNESYFWKLVAAADADDAVTREPSRKARRRGTAGSPDTLYDRDDIKRVVKAWRARDHRPQQISQSSLATKTFPRTAVRRVIRLDDQGAFDLGPSGGLRLRGINGEFRAAPKKVSLRALERALRLAPFGRR